MPRASADPEVHREKTTKDDNEKQKDAAAEEVDDADKDKLYCICRTQYDEDRVMIACDRYLSTHIVLYRLLKFDTDVMNGTTLNA